MKYSKTALGLLNAQYRSVLRKCFLINAGLFALGAIATPANAADTWTGAITETDAFMDDLATTSGGAWDRNNGPVTGWGVDQILTVMQDAATNTDAAVALVNDASKGNEKLNERVSTLESAGYQNATQVGTAISNALADYSTTAQMNSAISTATNNMATQTWVEEKGYQTSAQVDSAVSAATAGMATQSWVEGKGYQTSAQVDSAVSAATAGMATQSWVSGQGYQTSAQVGDAITDAVNGLDATVSNTVGADGLSLSVTQTNGVITAITGSIASGTYATAAQGAKADQAATDIATINTTLSGYGNIVTHNADEFQTALDAGQLAAVNSGITAAGVAQITTNKNDIATINASDVMTSGITAAGVAQITTNKNDIATINTAITVTVDGDYISAGDGVADNLTALDTAVKNVADKNDVQDTAIGNIYTALNGGTYVPADGSVTGATALSTNFAADNLTAAANELLTDITVAADGNYITAGADVKGNLGALDSAIGKVAAGTYNAIAPANNVAANLQALDSAFTSGTIDASFDDTTVKTLKIDGANKITASGTTLDFAKNSLINVQGLTLTDASGNTGTLSADANGISTNTNFDVNGTLKVGDANQFVVDDSGNISTSGTLAAGNTTITGTLSTTGNATIGGTLDAGATTVDSLTIDGTSYGINSTGAATFASTDTASLTVGSANAITSTASGVLNMGGNDLTNIDELTTTGNATIGGNTSIAGTLSAGATTISASGAGATTALNVTATDTSGSGSTTTFTVASDKATVGGDFEVTGDTNLSDTTVTGTLTISDGATPTPNAINLAATSVNAKEYGGSSYSPQNVLGIDNDTFVDGKLSSTDSLSVFKDSDGTGTKYDEVFTVDSTGSISSDMLKTDNTNNTTTIGKDADTATNILGKLSLNSTGAATDPYVNAIDDGTTAQTTGGANTMATVATVLKSAENGAYTGASDKNIAADSTIKTAIGALDTEIGADTDYGTGTLNNGVVGTATVKANIAAINDKLGNIPDTAVNGYDMTAEGATLVGAVNKLDTNMEGVLGGIYNTTTGAYDNTALLDSTNPNGFAEGTTDLTDALTGYAANVQAAMGTEYEADGTFANDYESAHDGVSYYGLTSDTDLVSAIAQLEENIGEAITGVNRDATLAAATTAGTKTVNANIEALDTAIGDLDYTGGTVSYELANGSATTGIKTLVATIGTQADNTYKNLDDAGAEATINDNLDALDAAIGDRSNIASKNDAINQGTARNVAAGLKAAGDAIGDMNFGQSHYVSAQNDLSGAVRTLDSNLYRVETDLHDLKRDLNRGMASMAAMSALVPNPRAHGNTSLAIGTGAYSGHTAAAIGGFHYLTDNIMLNAGAAWGNSRDASYRMGVTFSW